jgi:glycosyltransferase involved in cell wall biosynthesis
MGRLRPNRAECLQFSAVTPYNACHEFQLSVGNIISVTLLPKYKILILAASFPYPPTSGGALRTYGILHGLANAGHQITLLAFDDLHSQPEKTPLAQLCRHIETVPMPVRSRLDRLRDMLLTSHADIAKRLFSLAFQEKLLSLLQATAFDIVQFEGIEVACYLPVVKQAGVKARLIFDTFNAEAELQRLIYDIDRQQAKRLPAAFYSYIQTQRIARYEGELCQMADAVIAVSPEDAGLLQAYLPQKSIPVVPSGVFVNDYMKPQTNLSLPANSLVFTGKMDYRPNVDAMLWFAFHIFPQLHDANLVIVGQKPHPRIQKLTDYENIMLTGWVESVLPYLHQADVYIAPLRMGSGTRLKILEAMACGCAIVATSTAAAGLNDAARSAMIITDDEAEFASAIEHLLDHPAQRDILGNQAKAAVKAHYDWSVLIPKLLEVYQDHD